MKAFGFILLIGGGFTLVGSTIVYVNEPSGAALATAFLSGLATLLGFSIVVWDET